MGNSSAARLSGRDRGSAGIRASPRTHHFSGGYYLEARPLRSFDTVQRSRVLDIRAGNRTACSLAYQAVNKTRWGYSGRARCCLSLPTQPRSPEADQAERQICPATFPCAVTTLPHATSLSLTQTDNTLKN